MNKCPRCGGEMVEGAWFDFDVIPPVSPESINKELKVEFYSCDQCGYIQMRPLPPSR